MALDCLNTYPLELFLGGGTGIFGQEKRKAVKVDGGVERKTENMWKLL